jgi:signal transduction histidine kinase
VQQAKSCMTTTTFKEVRKQFLQSIISESDRLNRLIDKILDLEKFETGKQKLYLSKKIFPKL